MYVALVRSVRCGTEKLRSAWCTRSKRIGEPVGFWRVTQWAHLIMDLILVRSKRVYLTCAQNANDGKYMQSRREGQWFSSLSCTENMRCMHACDASLVILMELMWALAPCHIHMGKRTNATVGTLHVGMPGKPAVSKGGIFNQRSGRQQRWAVMMILDPSVMLPIVIAELDWDGVTLTH